MRVPVTDAFDDTDQLQSLEVELTPKQIEWLEREADERGLSVDHMLRSIITAQIRGTDEPSTPAPTSGDGTHHSAAPDPSGVETAADRTTDEDDDSDSPSIVDSLRTASERLQDLTEEDEDETSSDLYDTLDRLEARLGDTSSSEEASEEETPGTILLDDRSRSMFDMVDE